MYINKICLDETSVFRLLVIVIIIALRTAFWSGLICPQKLV